MKKYIYLVFAAILAIAGFQAHKSHELNNTKLAAESHAKAASQLLDKQWGAIATLEGDVEDKIQRETKASIEIMRELEGLHNKEIIESSIAYLKGVQSTSSSNKDFVSNAREYVTEMALLTSFMQMAEVSVNIANMGTFVSTTESRINSAIDHGDKFKQVCTTMHSAVRSLRDAKYSLQKHVNKDALVSDDIINKISSAADSCAKLVSSENIKLEKLLITFQSYR